MAAMLMVRLSSIKLMMQAMLTLLQGRYTLIPMMLVLLPCEAPCSEEEKFVWP